MLNTQFVQAHNTYAYYGRKETSTGFADLLDELYDEGVRGIELDAWQDDGNWTWSIAHTGGYVATPGCQLSAYLAEVSAWSLRRRKSGGHDPLIVIVEMKDDSIDHGFPDAFDKYLGSALAQCPLFSPRAVLHTVDEHLADALDDASRWPSLVTMRNSLMVCLSGDGAKNAMYSSANHALRLAFADHPAAYTPGNPASFIGPNRMVLSIGSGPGGALGSWEDVLNRIVTQSKCLGRIWWDHIEQIGLGEHIADSVSAFNDGAWCVASDSAHDLLPQLAWRGFRRRPGS